MVLNETYNMKMRMQAGEKVYGTLIGPGNVPEKTVRALRDFGFDFFMVDLEHSLVNKETIWEYIRTSRKTDMPVMIRVEDKAAYFRRYIDAGVNGLMLPQVDTVEEAAQIVNKAYFPPIGNRGTGIGLSPYVIDGQDLAKVPFLSLTEYVNNNTVIFPQTESLENIRNLPHILSLEGITGTVVGPYDLALNIGGVDPKAVGTEMVATPVMEDKMKRVAEICRKAGKIAGIGGQIPKALARRAKEGYQFFLIGGVVDGNVENLRPVIKEARALVGQV
ncbi:MAG: aldolase/citrate lyase family protein [Dehalococcoidales bacterium]|jgi:2-keto-3-deoxy-L-rhamnonate aldolase RhmA|nr:aldolase/citrate lyase family protein [Dehalococcoidales bacterium]